MPSDSAVTPVLLGVLRSHPEEQQLLVMVYSLLCIVASQGGCWTPLGVEAGVGGPQLPPSQPAVPPQTSAGFPPT